MLGILPGFRLWVQFLEVTEAGNCWSAALARRAAVSGGVARPRSYLPHTLGLYYYVCFLPSYSLVINMNKASGRRFKGLVFFLEKS